jgi:hypothetical protein
LEPSTLRIGRAQTFVPVMLLRVAADPRGRSLTG